MAVVDAMAVQIKDSEYDEPAETSGDADSSEIEEINNTPVPAVATVDPSATGADRFKSVESDSDSVSIQNRNATSGTNSPSASNRTNAGSSNVTTITSGG